jgi:membrane associated rhomboid family serine protease
MFSEIGQDLENFTETSKQFIPTLLWCLSALWLFNAVNWQTGSKLNRFGIWPRHAIGLIGIPMSPLLHANFTHLLFNTTPLFVLGLFIMTLGLRTFYVATLMITLLAGTGVWLFGRNAIHIGASGVIAGYFGFVLASAYEQPNITTFFCAGVAIYYFGGILFSLFPTEEKVSWEGHLIGFISGLITLYLIQNYDYIAYKMKLWVPILAYC